MLAERVDEVFPSHRRRIGDDEGLAGGPPLDPGENDSLDEVFDIGRAEDGTAAIDVSVDAFPQPADEFEERGPVPGPEGEQAGTDDDGLDEAAGVIATGQVFGQDFRFGVGGEVGVPGRVFVAAPIRMEVVDGQRAEEDKSSDASQRGGPEKAFRPSRVDPNDRLARAPIVDDGGQVENDVHPPDGL